MKKLTRFIFLLFTIAFLASCQLPEQGDVNSRIQIQIDWNSCEDALCSIVVHTTAPITMFNNMQGFTDCNKVGQYGLLVTIYRCSQVFTNASLLNYSEFDNDIKLLEAMLFISWGDNWESKTNSALAIDCKYYEIRTSNVEIGNLSNFDDYYEPVVTGVIPNTLLSEVADFNKIIWSSADFRSQVNSNIVNGNWYTSTQHWFQSSEGILQMGYNLSQREISRRLDAIQYIQAQCPGVRASTF